MHNSKDGFYGVGSGVWAFLILFCAHASAHAAGPGAFSLTGLAGWDEQIFKKKTPTAYELLREGDTQVLRADCKASASGYVAKSTVDLNKTPKLRWRWKLENLYAGIAERDKRGDDFPARVYVVRDGGWRVWRTLSLVYVWSNGEAGAEHWPNPYTRQAHMVPVRAGKAGLGEWRNEERDVRADFKKYFDEDVQSLDALALMSDCDDAGGAARAWYGDIRWSAP